ncbi:restriction endonuclease [Patescibacteria group bacterium]|nr:restriction endonuclease [Patescibacteria group bacterium]MBU1124068.1 restriction endonuclease [Patescibacteria group bacterium]
MTKTRLTKNRLLRETKVFAPKYSKMVFPEMYGVTDGKAVGTFIEHKFREYLSDKYQFIIGNSAKGIDFPDLGIDIKVTSIKQPQSSCPYKSVRQKIYGLGYSLLVFVYDKTDDHKHKTGRLNFLHTIFVEKEYTADFQTTKGLREIIENEGNTDDIVAFIHDRNLPIDDIEANEIAEELLEKEPTQGYLTISNALQWRLQYGRIIQVAGNVDGIHNLLN